MTKQITASNSQVTALYRFIGRDIFIKCNNKQYVAQLSEQIKNKGGSIEVGRTWIKADIIGMANKIILSGNEIDLENSTNYEIENFISNFFLTTLKKANFKCEVKEI